MADKMKAAGEVRMRKHLIEELASFLFRDRSIERVGHEAIDSVISKLIGITRPQTIDSWVLIGVGSTTLSGLFQSLARWGRSAGGLGTWTSEAVVRCVDRAS